MLTIGNYLGNYWRLSYPIGEKPIGDYTGAQGCYSKVSKFDASK